MLLEGKIIKFEWTNSKISKDCNPKFQKCEKNLGKISHCGLWPKKSPLVDLWSVNYFVSQEAYVIYITYKMLHLRHQNMKSHLHIFPKLPADFYLSCGNHWVRDLSIPEFPQLLEVGYESYWRNVWVILGLHSKKKKSNLVTVKAQTVCLW